MKFKLDENLPGEIAGDLRSAGHDAQTVGDEGLGGAPDSMLLRKAREEERTLLTLDKGIANIRTYPRADYPGVVLFRPDSLGRGTVLAFVRGYLPGVLEMDLRGRLLVITNRGVRIR